MTVRQPDDLEAVERRTHLLLTAIPPQAVPLGFKAAVMRRVVSREAAVWEWIVAAVLALPALGFLVFQVTVHGNEFSVAVNNVVSAASAESADAFFFVDGTTVLALAILGIASLIAAHASIVVPARGTSAR